MLEAIGEDPVSSLESGLDDAEVAESKLARITKEFLSKGWHCNTEENVILTPDTAGEITVGDGVLRIDTVGNSSDIDVTLRGGKLYNLTDRTFTFSGDLTVTWSILLDFEELPYAVANYIAYDAAYRYQKDRLGSGALGSQIKEDREVAFIGFMDAEGQEDDLNVFDAPDLQYIRRNNRYLGGR